LFDTAPKANGLSIRNFLAVDDALVYPTRRPYHHHSSDENLSDQENVEPMPLKPARGHLDRTFEMLAADDDVFARHTDSRWEFREISHVVTRNTIYVLENFFKF